MRKGERIFVYPRNMNRTGRDFKVNLKDLKTKIIPDIIELVEVEGKHYEDTLYKTFYRVENDLTYKSFDGQLIIVLN